MKWLRRVWFEVKDFWKELWGYEQPDIGLSGYPRHDIRTHRSIAGDISALAGFTGLFLSGFILYSVGGDIRLLSMQEWVGVVMGLVFVVAGSAFANDFRTDALRWENSLLERRVRRLEEEIGVESGSEGV